MGWRYSPRAASSSRISAIAISWHRIAAALLQMPTPMLNSAILRVRSATIALSSFVVLFISLYYRTRPNMSTHFYNLSRRGFIAMARRDPLAHPAPVDDPARLNRFADAWALYVARLQRGQLDLVAWRRLAELGRGLFG